MEDFDNIEAQEQDLNDEGNFEGLEIVGSKAQIYDLGEEGSYPQPED